MAKRIHYHICCDVNIYAWPWVFKNVFWLLNYLAKSKLRSKLFHIWALKRHCTKISLRISSVNVTKFSGNYGFGHIYWRNHEKLDFFVQWEVLSVAYKLIDFAWNYPIITLRNEFSMTNYPDLEKRVWHSSCV